MTVEWAPFEVMVTGEKKEEFRLKTAWMGARLIDGKTREDRKYDLVEFVNGYGKHRPSFTTSFKGYQLKENGVFKKYSNGLVVDTRGKPTYVIKLGGDIKSKNLGTRLSKSGS